MSHTTSISHDASLHLPAGSVADDAWSTLLTPGRAGWAYTGLRVANLQPGGQVSFTTDDNEAIVLPLAGAASVMCGAESADLAGRADPFGGPTDFVYLPRDASATLTSTHGGRFAVATARSQRRLPFRHAPAATVPVERRGAGTCAREVRNLALPAAFEADRLIVVEVLTPGGNWSSYPPHKHDSESPSEAALEEIYYFEIAAGPGGRPGLGYQRVYGTGERPIDLLVEVRDGDVVLVPHGWHGPSMAAPGYDMYYLNVMAGPGERAWKITDDPAHAWVRDTWQ